MVWFNVSSTYYRYFRDILPIFPASHLTGAKTQFKRVKLQSSYNTNKLYRN